MSQSIAKIYIHIIFSTKHREPVLLGDLETSLHKFLAGICRNLNCHANNVGGHHDHIHILCRLSKTITIAKLVEEIKISSSKWMKMQRADLSNFHWQRGYAVFSVSQSNLPNVGSYIEDQWIHHCEITFQDELRKLLIENGMQFDERYLWD